jgi:hypothetical protein
MSYLAKYEVPPPPTAPPATDEWEFQESARRLHMTFYNPPDLCFFCSRPLLCEHLVMWSGDKEIWMHAACAVRLGRHLVKDGMTAYHTLEGYQNGGFCHSGRDDR